MEIDRPWHRARLKSLLGTSPVVAILGLRQAGKTTLARALARKWPGGATIFDLENPADLSRLADPIRLARARRGRARRRARRVRRCAHRSHRAQREPHRREQVFRKIEAYERFVNVSAIGLGILQMLAIRFPKQVWECFPLWLRTYQKHECPSENVVRLTLQQELHRISLETRRGLLIEDILATKHTADADADHPMRLVAGAAGG